MSAEPLLESVDLDLKNFGWVISGGESGVGEKWRPAEIEWFLNIRDQCLEANVPFFHKQHGGNRKFDKAWGGRILAGKTWDEMPKYKVSEETDDESLEYDQLSLIHCTPSS